MLQDLNRNANVPNSNYGMGSGMSGPGMGNMSNYNGGSPWPSAPSSQSFQQSWPNTSHTQSQAQQMQHPSSGNELACMLIVMINTAWNLIQFNNPLTLHVYTCMYT